MAGLKNCVFLALTATLVAGLQNVIRYEMDKLEKSEQSLIEAWWRDEILAQRAPGKIESFSWSDCGGSKKFVNITNLSVTPDPIKIPGPINVATSFVVNSALVAPEKGHVEWRYRIASIAPWIKLPCIDRIGSCDYDDVCALLSQITSCPQELVKIGINCTCPVASIVLLLQISECLDVNPNILDIPIKSEIRPLTRGKNDIFFLQPVSYQKSYTIPQTEFKIDAAIFPFGDHEITGSLTYNGQEAACLKIKLSFKPTQELL